MKLETWGGGTPFLGWIVLLVLSGFVIFSFKDVQSCVVVNVFSILLAPCALLKEQRVLIGCFICSGHFVGGLNWSFDRTRD